MSGRQNPCRRHYAGCTADPPKGATTCDGCRLEHNRRAAERRAELAASGKCTVCGARAARVDGETLATCPIHREYFATRAVAARAATKAG